MGEWNIFPHEWLSIAPSALSIFIIQLGYISRCIDYIMFSISYMLQLNERPYSKDASKDAHTKQDNQVYES